MKNQALLENYYLPGDLEARLAAFVDYYNHERFHESQENLTPADVYFGCGQSILESRAGPVSPLNYDANCPQGPDDAKWREKLR